MVPKYVGKRVGFRTEDPMLILEHIKCKVTDGKSNKEGQKVVGIGKGLYEARDRIF